MKIIRGKLAPLTPIGVRVRYDEATGAVQVSYDGGNTWVNEPEYDPRLNNHTPPPDTADPRCAAAERITAGTQEVIEYVLQQLDTTAALATIVQGAIRLLTPLFTYIPYLSLVYTAINAIAGLGSLVLHSAFDSFDFSSLKCLLYCRLDAEGRLNQDSFEALLADIADAYDDVVEAVLYNLYSMAGFAGLNDQAYIRAEDGDCTSCNCNWDMCVNVEYLWSLSYPENCPNPGCPANLSFSPQGELSTYNGLPAIKATKTLGDNANRIGRRFLLSLPEGSTLTSIRVSPVRVSGNLDQFTTVIGTNGLYTCTSGAFQPNPRVRNGSWQNLVMLYLGLGTAVANDGSSVYYRQVRLIGTGVKPPFPEVQFVNP